MGKEVLHFREWRRITDDIIPGIYPYYLISNFGEIFSENKSSPLGVHLLCPSMNGRGYQQIPLGTINGRKTMKVHRLVLLVFEYNPNHANLEVNHIDGVKIHNCLWNLEWVSSSENSIHAINNGLKTVFRSNTTALPDSEIISMLQEYQNGYSTEYLSYKYRISIISIRNIIGCHNRPNIGKMFNLPNEKTVNHIIYSEFNYYIINAILGLVYQLFPMNDIVEIVSNMYMIPRDLSHEIAIKRIIINQ